MDCSFYALVQNSCRIFTTKLEDNELFCLVRRKGSLLANLSFYELSVFARVASLLRVIGIA